MQNTLTPFFSPYLQDTIPEIMTVPELAEYLGIGKNKAYQLLKTGTIHGFRIGSTWKVSKEAVKLFVKEKSELQ